MKKAFGMLSVLVGSVALFGCETGIGDGNETPPTEPPSHDSDSFDQIVIGAAFADIGESMPWDRCWSQYQGDPDSSGFLFVGSDEVGAVKWRRAVGEVLNSSPVIGPDGTIYVGTAAGELVAMAADGRERWRRDFFPDAAILSTPAVAEDGSIFVIYQQRDDDGNAVSTLNRVSPDGRWLWARLIGDTLGFTSASPKVLNGYVYVSAHTPGLELLVFDFDANIVARAPTAQCTPICGSFDWGGLWDDITSFSSDACCVAVLPFCVVSLGCRFDDSGESSEFPVYELMDDPAVAVSDMPGLADDGNPLVVVLNGFCMTAYRFEAPELKFLWQRKVYGGGCDDDPVRHASPAILANGQLVICNEKGKVKSYDPLTGDKLWDYDAGEPVRAPATSFGRQVYVVSENYAHLLESDGEQLDAMSLSAPTRLSPVVSGSFLYAVTSETVHSIEFDFETRTVDHRLDGGASSPAIGPDGTVYVVNTVGELIAYGKRDEVPGAVDHSGPGGEVVAQ